MSEAEALKQIVERLSDIEMNLGILCGAVIFGVAVFFIQTIIRSD